MKKGNAKGSPAQGKLPKGRVRNVRGGDRIQTATNKMAAKDKKSY